MEVLNSHSGQSHATGKGRVVEGQGECRGASQANLRGRPSTGAGGSDPKHWQQFYDELAIETYAALAGRLFSGHSPEEAVELTVEDISGKMRREALHENVVQPYRDELLQRGLANLCRDAQAWLHEVDHEPERRHPERALARPQLATAHRRRQDVDVERL